MSKFVSLLQSQQTLLLDGGLATQLEAMGHDLSSELWSAKLLLSQPQAIVDAHRAYFEAGAHCAITASYQASVPGFMKLGLNEQEAKNLIALSVELAKQARDEFVAAHPDQPVPLVAASVGPYGATLADGSEYTGQYGISDGALADFHRQRLHLLDQTGADVLACETIPSLQEAKVLASLLADCQTPAWISFSCKSESQLSDGSSLAACAELFNQHPKVKAVGINCTSPVFINDLIQAIRSTCPQQNIVVYPNSGETYRASDNSWHGTATPLECGLAAKDWRKNGANIIGGCCRMGPEHIQQIKQQLT